MPTTDSVTAQALRLRQALIVAAHFATIADEIRHSMPIGYAAERSADRVSRPVEDVISANDDLGITDAILSGRRKLQHAAQLVETAARQLSVAVSTWERSCVESSTTTVK